MSERPGVSTSDQPPQDLAPDPCRLLFRWADTGNLWGTGPGSRGRSIENHLAPLQMVLKPGVLAARVSGINRCRGALIAVPRPFLARLHGTMRTMRVLAHRAPHPPAKRRPSSRAAACGRITHCQKGMKNPAVATTCPVVRRPGDGGPGGRWAERTRNRGRCGEDVGAAPSNPTRSATGAGEFAALAACPRALRAERYCTWCHQRQILRRKTGMESARRISPGQPTGVAT